MSKKITAVILALVMILGMIPALSLFAGAATVSKNVAAGKSGRTGTSNNVPGLTDGNYGTIASDINWNANVSQSSCWAEVDLGQPCDLEAVLLVQYYNDSRYYHWEAYASNDNTLPVSGWTKIAEKSDNTLSSSTGYRAPVTTAISARYVRIYGTYSSANIGFHFNEIEIYASVPFEPQTWTSGSLTYVLDEHGTLTVSGTGAIADYASTASRPWNEFTSIITSVVIESGVTAIGKNAFANCGTIGTVTLPASVTAIKENAFSGTTVEVVDCALPSEQFIAGLTVNGSGNDGFWRGSWINDPNHASKGYISNTISWNFNSGILTVSGTGAIPELTPASRPWKAYDDSVTEIRIGNGITEVGKTAFSHMTHIEKVVLPESVTSLQNDAFAYCSSIDYLVLPSGITKVAQGVLFSTSVSTICCSLTYAEFRSNLTVFGAYNDSFEAATWTTEAAPATLINLTRGKTPEVTAGTGASYITDGNKSGGFWDGGVAPAEVTIDLGTGAFISSFNIVTYYGDGRYYHYEIYTSLDGRNYTLVAEKQTNEAALATGENYYFDEPLNARYLRISMTFNSANASVHLREVTALGEWDPDYVEPVPVEGDQDDPDNIAYGKPVRSALSTDKAGLVTDGSAATYFTAVYYPTYVDIDLMEEYDLDDVVVFFPVRTGRYYYYTIYGSNDLASFDRLYQKRTNELADADGDLISLSGETYRFIRIYIEYVSAAGTACLAEVRAHGTPTGANTDSLRTGSIDEILGIEDFDDTEFAAPITEAETIENVYGIVDRTVGPQYRSWFTFALAPAGESGNDYFTLQNASGKIKITANTGVCLAAGLNHYYKYYCGVEISEQARQTKMPAAIVPVEGLIRRETPYKIRYAFNYCTLDYSFAFFGEEDFVRENDWLALSGVNVVLDLAGQEAVWIKFLMNFGYSFDEARDWIAGPAYYAWQFMDNLENYGGPVPDGWIVDRLNMARRTQRFKRSLGIDTVLQGYAGMIPTNFADYQNVDILKQGGWCGLSRPDMIRTDGTLYDEYAALFYEAQRWALGETSNYYAADPFHEGGIRPADLSDETIAAEVLDSLLSYDPDAVWMVQAWWSNPTNGLLNGMGTYRQDHVIILDLTADKWNTTTYGSTTLDSTEFNGTDWVWCLLKNYGGNPSMDGKLSNLVTKIPEACATAEHMKGIGLISEATLDNPVVYQLLFDMAWYTESIDLDAWLDDYVVRRYGAPSENAREAWTILKEIVYNRQGNSTQIIARVPDNVGKAYPSNAELRLEKALRLLIADFDTLKDSEAYRYDLSEVMRQLVSNYACYAHNDVTSAFNANDLAAFRTAKEKFLAVFDIFNEVLGTEKDLMAGTWIGRAEDWAANYDDFGRDTLPLSAKALITTWASMAACNSIPDYAYRHYEGMVIDVYKARWEIFLNKQEAYLENGTEIVKMSQSDYFHFYWNWVMHTPEYSRTVNNEPNYMFALAQRVLNECTIEEVSPENVGNIAKDRPATASAEYDSPGANGGYAGNANDGTVDTYWDGGSYLENPELVIDLGAVYDVSRFNVVNYVDGVRYYQYDLYVSVDGETWTLAASRTGTDPASAAGDVFEVAATGRYVKLIGRYNSANDAFHVSELRAYGTAHQAALIGDVNADGEVTIEDVSALLNILSANASDAPAAADVNNDREVTIEDVTAILDILAS